MAISDLQSALEIFKRVSTEFPPKTAAQQRLVANLNCGITYLEDGITSVRMTAHGVKPEFIADEILNQLPLEEENL